MKKQKKYNILNTLLRLYGTAFSECPVRMFVYSFVLFINGIIQIAITYGMEVFYENVNIGIQQKAISFTIIGSLVFLIAAILMSHILNGLDNYLGTSMHVVLIGKFEERMHKKSVKIDPILFENTEFLDNVNKAFQGSGVSGCTFVLVAFMVVLFSNVPYMILMSVYLYRLQPLLAICILIVFVPVVISQYVRIHYFANLEDETAHDRRECGYYNDCITSREYYKETRMLGAFRYFMKLIKSSILRINDKALKCYGKMAKLEICMRMITLIGYIGVILLLVRYISDGSISVGAFAAVFASISTMFEIVESAVGQQLGGVFEKIGLVRNYVKFLDMDELQGQESHVDYSKGIQMNNVSFSYMGDDRQVIRNMNLNIQKGETVAIVGENGAGKSTLIKLLTGIYRPNQGNVYIGGVDTREIKMDNYNKKISGVFQNFQKYKMSLEDNIIISESDESKENRVEECLSNVDINVKDFTDGIQTVLSTEFGGIDVSGGQWQRLAIARGFYKDSEIIVLDEPTAAIDPLEEYEVYNNFKKIAKDKIALLVTHRMGSCKIADRIIVVDDGQIVEEGTHEELMNKNGYYHKMYEAQAQWYN